MKNGKNRWAQNGFTIIEVMMFLAVSGFMFVLAAVFINGKQSQVEYRQGVQAAASTMANVINAVSNGEFPPAGDFKCSVSGGSAPQFTAGNKDQGTNGGCTFLGKVIEFPVKGSTTFSTYTLASRQYAPTSGGTCTASTDTVPVESFCEAMPVVLAGQYSGWPKLTEQGTLENGTVGEYIYLCKDAACSSSNRTHIAGVGFFGSFAAQGDATATGSSGAQSLQVVSIPYGGIDSLASQGDADTVTSGEYILLCLKNGSNVGSVQVGGPGGQQASVSVNYGKLGPCQ